MPLQVTAIMIRIEDLARSKKFYVDSALRARSTMSGLQALSNRERSYFRRHRSSQLRAPTKREDHMTGLKPGRDHPRRR